MGLLELPRCVRGVLELGPVNYVTVGHATPGAAIIRVS